MPNLLYPPVNTWYPWYRRLGGPREPVWTGMENFTPHWDSIPSLSSPKVNWYTNYAIPAIC
jgi:hypothetical protein